MASSSTTGGKMVTEGSVRPEREQGSRRLRTADVLTASRLPLAVAFVAVPSTRIRVAILVTAAVTDLLDGYLARRFGGSRLGAVLDPIADKLFMASAFLVVALSGVLAPYEILGVLLRDLVASIAFVATLVHGRPTAIPARVGGKAVTVGQMLTLLAFLAGSSLVRPLAWATAAIALYAIWDYHRVRDAAARHY